MTTTTACAACGEPIVRLPGSCGWYQHAGEWSGVALFDHEARPAPAPTSELGVLKILNTNIAGGAR